MIKTRTKLHPAVMETFIYVFTRKGKHRASEPFLSELKNYLNNPSGKYFFLSEDYYPCWVEFNVDGSGFFSLTVETQKPGILKRTEQINADLSSLLG